MRNRAGVKVRASIAKDNDKCISESDYINIMIINNIDENKIFTAFSLNKLINSLKEDNFKNILLSFHYLCNSNQQFNILKGKEYLNTIFHILLFIMEADNEKLKIQKKIFLDDMILLVEKLFLSKKLSDKDILLLLKFIAFTSFQDRKEITQQSLDLLMHLSNSQIKNYKRFEFIFQMIKKLNCPKITYDFCIFLQKHIFKNKENFFLFTKKTDLLNFLFLNDEDDKILKFLSEIYSFNYNRGFITIFIDKIKEAYDIKNKNNKTIEVLSKLNKTISFISELKRIEDSKYEKDPFLLSKCFAFNNHKYNGIYVNNIQIQNSFTLIFSFCFSPSKSQKNKEFPIINIIDKEKSEKNGLSFSIKDGLLFFKNFFNDKKGKICSISENQTYLCYYTVKEKENYSLQITSKESYSIKNKFNFLLKKTIYMQIGKYNQQNFEGFIGPVLIFRKQIEDIPKNLFQLKGLYEKGIYYHDYNTNEIDIYDKLMNNEPEKYCELKRIFQGKEELSKYLITYVTPMEEGQSLNKSHYYNTTFNETKINFYTNPKPENGATYPFFNKYSIFEFLKFEGLNYIVLILELITTNVENMNEDTDKEIVLNLFKNIINFIVKILQCINIEYYTEEIRYILFSLEKCIIKICKKIKMTNEMSESLKYLILFLTTQGIEKQNKKIENFIYIRNEICKFLLDIELYNLSNFYSIECFLFSLDSSLIKNCYGLTSIEIFKKLMNFTTIYNQKILPQKDEIMHSKEYKSIKHELTNAIINYLSRCEKMQPFNEIFQLFSKEFEFDYKNYQFFKIFYISSEYFFENNNKNIISVYKYYIDLYEYLEQNNSNSINDTIKKEKNIIMALCLRIFLEYTIKENPPKLKKARINSKKLTSKSESKIKSDIYSTKSAVIEDNGKFNLMENIEINLNIEENNENEEKKVELNDIIVNTKQNMDIQSEKINRHLLENKNTINNYKENYASNSSNKSENINNNFKSNNTDSTADDPVINCKKYNSSADIININNEIELDNENFKFRKYSDENYLDDKVMTLNSKITGKFKMNDYFSFSAIFQNLFSFKNINDYIFKSIILFILEKNNNINIPQKIKYKFIVKTKEYKDLKDTEYEEFLKINYFNDETKEQLLKILDLLEKNNNNLSRISYEIMIYLIMTIAKERNNNKCVFLHFTSSRKVCCKIFLLTFLNNKESSKTLLKEFPEMLELILPYQKKSFIFSFLYNFISKKELIDYGILLINMLLKTNFDKEINPKLYYLYKINSVILLYRIIKSNNIIINEKFNLDEQGLSDLFNIDLVTSKYNILKDISNNRKKTYIELLFEIIIVLYLKTRDEKYFNVFNNLFIYNTKIKKPNESKTILYYLDTLKKMIFKNQLIDKILKNYEIIEDRYFTLLFFYKSLKYWMKSETTDIKNKILLLIKDFFFDAKLFYKDNISKIKKLKNKNDLVIFIKDILEENTAKDQTKYIQIEELVFIFRGKYKEFKIKQKKELKNLNNSAQPFRKSLLNFFGDNNKYQGINDVNENLKAMELNDSFSSCKSSKSKKEKCKNNKRKKMKVVKKKTVNELVNNEEGILNFDETEDIDIENKHNLTFTPTNKELSYISTDSIQTNINIFSLDFIDSPNKVILFPKLSLLNQIFGTYFTELFFYNEPFINMKNLYKYKIKKNHNTDISIDNFFDYPIITRNYIPKKLYFGGLFIKHDLNFFANRYFHISHPYFINRAKESKSKRIFPKISEQNDILDYIMDKNDNSNITFIVDLVTNRCVYFGELIIGKHLIYFHNIDKEKFLKGKTEEEIENYLLCSPLCDYSPKNKKLYIFKKEITEIINRRFLYLFQACEFYLKNGKSYYFNLYSEEKKIQFFSLFGNKDYNSYDIKIISDLKTEFKRKDYTNQWLKNNISTLEYLLFINKYSCRSYNDINQYPVFPWLRIINDKKRDLKNTIAAQTEDKRMMLKEKYTLSSETFPYHYTTHYSNASFLLYYLVRINPFTDNQITLQNNKFDSPGRQFNSIDELLKILSSTSQPREIIPEFFINTEFYYNYNCNFFGIKNKKDLINNLENKTGYDTPLDYILSNAIRLELPEIKSEINYFFDNVFGIGQMGGQDRCNTYDKYSYQEMIDLRQKITQYKIKKLSLKEIRAKIDSKSNKIISFGQTPFKLLEDQHPQWTNNIKDNEKNSSKQNNETENIYNSSSLTKIIFINKSRNNSNKKYIYALISNLKEKEKINHYELKFFEKNLKEDISKLIKIQKKIKFFKKLRVFNNDNNFYFYKYNPKLLLLDFNMSLFVFCRFNDKSFSIFDPKGEWKSYLTESIVTCLAKSSEKSFFTGHNNGKIIEWKFNSKNINNILIGEENIGNSNINISIDELIVKRRYIAHTEKVSGIYYSDLLGLIITSGDDNKILIRKYYDLTLLTMINININKFCFDIKISHCYLYILFFDELVKKHKVEIYSVNGIKVGEGNYNYINGITIDKNGNVLVGYYKENKIEVFNPAMTKKIDDIDINVQNSKKNVNEKNLSIKKRKSSKKIVIDKTNYEEIYFTDFVYEDESSSLYCSFSNGQIVKKKYKYNNENL